jgi:hypothetical protein
MKILGNLMVIAGLVLLLANIAYAPGSSSSASSVADTYYTDCALNVSLVNQNPYPAQPDSYVDVVFQVNWMQNYVCNGSRFELIKSYPFSLDSNDWVRVLPDDTYIQDYKKAWMVPYKLRVDKDALYGDTEVKVQYSPGIWKNGTPTIKKFNITIQDSRTMFDAVLQQIQGSDVSIAITNAGKYAANSVIVRIPEQDDFMVIGTDGQMVGNLASGDYTVVSFTISPKSAQGGFRNASLRNQSNAVPSPRKLKFDVYYTDNIGERRVVNMELPYSVSGNYSMMNYSGFRTNGNVRSSSAKSNSSAILLIAAIVFIIVVLAIYLKFFRHRWKKAERTRQKDEVPDWIKNAKAKK